MRALKFFLVILILFGLFIAYHFSSNALVTTEEVFRDDETAQTQRSISNFLKVLERNKTNYIARGAHSKGHACVKIYFNINEDIPADLQYGIFSSPGKQYKGWIRFSNGSSSMKGNHDGNKDAHGMAIKLFNIYDDKLSKEEGDPETQDFLMHDSPVFFTKDIEDYNRFVESDNKILYFISDINPFNWRLREMKQGLATLKPPPASPLENQYFSNTAYKLGPNNIKFSAQSCDSSKITSVQEQEDPDFLRKIMAEQLKESAGCFNFMVQVQDPDKYMPIEDPSIEWKTSDSPFITIADINIPTQEFDSPEQQAFCENLSFSPWNALAQHRPIGQLNRIRKAVYKASSDYRHKKNNTELPTNLNW